MTRKITIFVVILTILALIITIFYKSLFFFCIVIGLFVSAVIYVIWFYEKPQIQGLAPILAPNPIYDNLPRTLRPPA